MPTFYRAAIVIGVVVIHRTPPQVHVEALPLRQPARFEAGTGITMSDSCENVV